MTTNRADAVWQMHREGKTVQQIARALKWSNAQVEAILASDPPKTRPAHDTRGSEMIDPYRADRLLRRWSWEGPEQTVRGA